MNTYVLLRLDHEKDVTIIFKLLYTGFSPMHPQTFVYRFELHASSSVKFDNDCDVIFMFKM